MSAGYSNPISEDDIKCVLCGHRPEIFGHETEVYDEGVRGKCRWKCDWCGQKGYAEFDSAFDSLTVKDEFSSMYVRYRKAPIRLSGLECHWCERPIELGNEDVRVAWPPVGMKGWIRWRCSVGRHGGIVAFETHFLWIVVSNGQHNMDLVLGEPGGKSPSRRNTVSKNSSKQGGNMRKTIMTRRP